MRPDGCVALARWLLDNADGEEARHRGAAHAAYYAVYHKMAAHYGLDPLNRRQSRHDLLIKRVREESVNAGSRAGSRADSWQVAIAAEALPSLHTLRTRADYDFTAPFTRGDALDAVARAERVFAPPGP